MGDTFLWMPRPRTIVVKDGKPVIDCNPKVGHVTVDVYNRIDVSGGTTNDDGCIVDWEGFARNSTTSVSVDPIDKTKITDTDGEISKSPNYVYRVEQFFPPYIDQDAASVTAECRLSATIATLPCVTATLGFATWNDPAWFFCTCQDSYEIECMPEDLTFNGALAISVTNESDFAVSISVLVDGREQEPDVIIQPGGSNTWNYNNPNLTNLYGVIETRTPI